VQRVESTLSDIKNSRIRAFVFSYAQYVAVSQGSERRPVPLYHYELGTYRSAFRLRRRLRRSIPIRNTDTAITWSIRSVEFLLPCKNYEHRAHGTRDGKITWQLQPIQYLRAGLSLRVCPFLQSRYQPFRACTATPITTSHLAG
jgi:hypothetical protein